MYVIPVMFWTELDFLQKQIQKRKENQKVFISRHVYHLRVPCQHANIFQLKHKVQLSGILVLQVFGHRLVIWT